MSAGGDNLESLRSRWQQKHPHAGAGANFSNEVSHDPSAHPEGRQDEAQTSHAAGDGTSSPESHIHPPQNRPVAHERRDSLEAEQYGQEENGRRNSEGIEGDLTELAEPAPVDRQHRRGSSYEGEERKERGKAQRGQSEHDDAFLTELAAPPPVEEEDEDRSPSQDEQKDAGSESPSFHSRDKKDEADEDTHSPTATHLYAISYLIFFSILGTLARLGIEAVNRYPQAPFSSVVLWANVGGSLFMGFLAEDRRLFRQEWGRSSKKWSFHLSKADSEDAEKLQKATAAHGKVKKTIPLFIGLSVGFCGSFTSFSSFIRDAFLALTNDLSSPSTISPFNTTAHSAPRNGGYSFEATLAILIIEVACSLCALHLGAHLALLTDPVTPTLPFKPIRLIIDPLIVFLGFGCWLGAIFLTIFPPTNFWRGRASFSLVFAPPGCLLRFYASKYLNARIPSFPLGTFFVNVFGTAILGMSYDLQHTRSIAAMPNGSTLACQVLEGIMEGFCGCATTVSTWVAELTTLRRRHAYIYGLTSMAVALGLLVAVMGSVGWTSGFGTPICSV